MTLYLRSSFSMMYPEGPQVYTQGFSDGGGGNIKCWMISELLQDGKVFLKTNYAVWKPVVLNVHSFFISQYWP